MNCIALRRNIKCPQPGISSALLLYFCSGLLPLMWADPHQFRSFSQACSCNISSLGLVTTRLRIVYSVRNLPIYPNNHPISVSGIIWFDAGPNGRFLSLNPKSSSSNSYLKIMSFLKFTALVALVVFASQGAMAAPGYIPPLAAAPSDSKSVTDGLSGGVGYLSGAALAATLPKNMLDEGIKDGGGIPPSPAAAPPKSVADDVLVTSAKGAALAGIAVLPDNMIKQAIKGAGGKVAREEDVRF